MNQNIIASRSVALEASLDYMVLASLEQLIIFNLDLQKITMPLLLTTFPGVLIETL